MPSMQLQISRKGKSSKSTTNTVENLKLQHAEELARANEEHVKKVESLEKEVQQCRTEIDTLRAISDEHSDTLMPLPSPSTTLKYVQNTQNRKARKMGGQGMSGQHAAIMVAQLKQQHKRDLAKAMTLHGKKVQLLKKEMNRYKAEMEALKLRASAIIDAKRKQQGCDSILGVNVKTGVADCDKENVAAKQVLTQKQIQSSTQQNNNGRGMVKSKSQAHEKNGDVENCCEEVGLDDNLRTKYERFFSEDYQFKKDPAWEEALALRNNLVDTTTTATNSAEIDVLCKDLIDFMTEVRRDSLCSF